MNADHRAEIMTRNDVARDIIAGFAAVTPTLAGVFRLIDKVGLDVALDIEENYLKKFSYLPAKSRDLLKSYVAQGKLGAKSGEGFYSDYQ